MFIIALEIAAIHVYNALWVNIMNEKNTNAMLKAFKAAFPYTLPIFAGFWFLSLAYGIMMNSLGFSFLYPLFMSLIIYGGSLEFVAAWMLTSAFAPLTAFITALLIQARHIFYGISMLDKFKGLGPIRYYLIFGMCDETFSINCSAEIPKDTDRGYFMFFVTLLNHFYWVSGAALGGILGSLLKINSEGIGFVMTAMFTVIFLEQFLKEKNHISSYIGIACSLLCLIIFGSEAFLIPSMATILIMLAVFKKNIETSSLREDG